MEFVSTIHVIMQIVGQDAVLSMLEDNIIIPV